MTKHTNCLSCHAPFTFFGRSDVGNGLCQPCDNARYEAENRAAGGGATFDADNAAKAAAVAAVLVTTEQTYPGVGHRLGVVSADVAFGAGPLKDIAVGLRDAFGGRSETMSKLMRDSRATAVDELRREALALGAKAVIAVSFSVTALPAAGGTMTLVTATGTAVVLEGVR